MGGGERNSHSLSPSGRNDGINDDNYDGRDKPRLSDQLLNSSDSLGRAGGAPRSTNGARSGLHCFSSDHRDRPRTVVGGGEGNTPPAVL